MWDKRKFSGVRKKGKRAAPIKRACERGSRGLVPWQGPGGSATSGEWGKAPRVRRSRTSKTRPVVNRGRANGDGTPDSRARAGHTSQCVAAMGSAPVFFAFQAKKSYPARALPLTCQEEQVPPGLPRSRSLANYGLRYSFSFPYCVLYFRLTYFTAQSFRISTRRALSQTPPPIR